MLVRGNYLDPIQRKAHRYFLRWEDRQGRFTRKSVIDLSYAKKLRFRCLIQSLLMLGTAVDCVFVPEAREASCHDCDQVSV